jgi:hypothetical protein
MRRARGSFTLSLDQPHKWIEHHTLIQNLKTLSLWVISFIKCSTSAFPNNVRLLTHTYYTSITLYSLMCKFMWEDIKCNNHSDSLYFNSSFVFLFLLISTGITHFTLSCVNYTCQIVIIINYNIFKDLLEITIICAHSSQTFHISFWTGNLHLHTHSHKPNTQKLYLAVDLHLGFYSVF